MKLYLGQFLPVFLGGIFNLIILIEIRRCLVFTGLSL